MEQKLTYNLAVRLFSDEKCFGPGVAQLLHRVQELHSLRAAAMSMNMAYSKAWTITKHAQAALGFPLLHSITGRATKKGASEKGSFVRIKGLEPPRRKASDPKSDVATNYTISASVGQR